MAADGLSSSLDPVSAAAQAVIAGDMNGNGHIDNFDIEPFVTALVSRDDYLAQYPGLIDFQQRGDLNRDGFFDNFDIRPFEDLLSRGNVQESQGVWISLRELQNLPTTGQAWETLFAAAHQSTSDPNLSNQDENTDVLTLAKALVGARQNDVALQSEARATILAAIGTEAGGRTLALGRNLASYVIAADLVGMPDADEARFRSWLRTVLGEQIDGGSLRSTHEGRPNNWGLMAGASRAAVAAYLGDAAELARVAQVFKGWLGDRSSYAGFDYGDLSWQADASAPVGINPVGAMKDGHSIDGALPEEMRRGGQFQWPPVRTNYPWGALQGAVVQAEILSRNGYDAWQWGDRAILRAVQFLYSIGWSATGDDRWILSLVNTHYGTSFAASDATAPGKIMGWTAWTHPAGGRATASVSQAPATALAVGLAAPEEVRVALDTAPAVETLFAEGAVPRVAHGLAAGLDQTAAVETPARRRLIRPVTEDNAPLEGCDLKSLKIDQRE